MKSEKLNVTQVAVLVGVSVPTLNMWYKWKKLHPRHELAKLLPKYTMSGSKNTRYWKMDDINSLIEFKNTIPRGRNGILSEVTQKYVKKEGKKN